MRPQTMAVSATPGAWEMNEARGVFVEQVIRPTGLIDPPVEVRPARTQVDDLVGEVRQVAQAGYRALVTVLTKRMAEDLTEYLHEQGIRVRYMHSRHRHAGAHRDHPRPAARRLRRAGRHQPAARGPRHSGMRAGRHSRRRQGRLPAQRDVADPDHRPRRAQRRRQRHPLCRHRSPARCSAPSRRPTAGARSRSNTTPRTASRRRASSARSTTSWTASMSATTC